VHARAAAPADAETELKGKAEPALPNPEELAKPDTDAAPLEATADERGREKAEESERAAAPADAEMELKGKADPAVTVFDYGGDTVVDHPDGEQ
jgi:hypothetical protein